MYPSGADHVNMDDHRGIKLRKRYFAYVRRIVLAKLQLKEVTYKRNGGHFEKGTDKPNDKHYKK